MHAKITTIRDSVEQKLQAMINREALLDGYLNRVVFKKYQTAQRQRFIAQNAIAEADGGGWAALNPVYARRKLQLYKTYDGGGRKMMIAT
jgi:hypothetical protein